MTKEKGSARIVIDFKGVKMKNIDKIKNLKITRNIHLIVASSLTLTDVPIAISCYHEPSNLLQITFFSIGLIALLEFYNSIYFTDEIDDTKEEQHQQKIKIKNRQK